MEELRKYKFGFNEIRIIESLPDFPKTGKWLYEDIINYQYKIENLSIEYNFIKSKNELFELLDEMIYYAKTTNYTPVLHLEAHGDKNGFDLFNPETNEINFIKWEEFSKKIEQINKYSRNRLIVVLGACFGSYLGLELLINFGENERAPFLLLIGANEKISPNEIKLGYSKFYKTLLESKDIGKGLLGILEETNKQVLQSAPTTAIKIVTEVYSEMNSPKFKEACRSFYERLSEDRKAILKGINYNRTMKNVLIFRKQQSEILTRKMYDQYLMIDLYPEIRDELPTFDEIWKK